MYQDPGKSANKRGGPMLEKVNFSEAIQSQLPFIELLINMGYTYISAEEALRQRGGDNANFILHDIAAKKLMELNGYDIDGVEYKFRDRKCVV